MANGYGPEQRRLLESVGIQIYSDAVLHGYVSAEDVRSEQEPDRQAATKLLVEIGLLSLDNASGQYVPTDPSAIQSQIVVPLGQRGADLLSESSKWSDTFTNLGQMFRQSPRLAERPITEIRGFANINSFIQASVADCRKELLTAQPHGRRPAPILAMAVERDIKALDRGITMRTLYQHSARQSPATRDYVAEITTHGGEVRTLDEFFNRLIVVDRRVAVLPGTEGHHVAIAVHDRSLVSYLADVFERSWERARPFVGTESRADQHVAADVRAMTIRLLVEGHSDPASAKRLGVSTRTFAAYIAALKEEYGAQTRFQLGYAMGIRGESDELAESADARAAPDEARAVPEK